MGRNARMGLFLAAIGLISCGVFVVAANYTPSSSEAERRAAARAAAQERQRIADNVIGSISYIKDPRTGFCFAYSWRGAANGGPALAAVPCEGIPRNLLIVARVR